MLFLAGMAWISFSCGGGGGGGSSDPPPSTPADQPAPSTPPPGGQNVSGQGLVLGKITDDANTPLGNVSVQMDSDTVTSNEQGFFTIDTVQAGTGKVVKYSKTGYMPSSRRVDVKAGQQTFLNLTLRKIGNSQAVNGAGTVTDIRTDGRNGSVTLAANTVVNASGQPVANYTVEITTLLPSDPNYANMFPGGFMGGSAIGSTANPQPLISYGIVNVDLKDSSGNPLNLAPGTTATVNFPIDPSLDRNTPTMPIWYLDQSSGIWVQQWTGQRSADNKFYTANVTHFTPLNCDGAVGTPSYKEVHVVGVDGLPVENATVYVEGPGYQQRNWTDSQGRATLTTNAGDRIRVWAEKGTLKSDVIQEWAAQAGNTIKNEILLVDPLVSVMLTWGATPWDLDAHMTGPLQAGGRFHVWYFSKGDLKNSPYCALDTDDVSSYGPEVVTVTKLIPGVYRYTVHNYSTQAGGAIENSGAVVNLVAPGGIIRRYEVPRSNPNNYNAWVVFELNVSAQGAVTITDINNFVNTEASGSQVTEKVKLQ